MSIGAQVWPGLRGRCGAGGCGKLLAVMNNLTPPAMPVRVFTLQLGWEKEREDRQDIRATMATISEVRPPLDGPYLPLAMPKV
jgi:hypothetical protein